MIEITLQSGATAKIVDAPFDEANDIYMAMAEELKPIRINAVENVANLYKDLFCVAVSSKKIKAAVEKVMARCLYNGARITKETWEPIEARADYSQVFLETFKVNVAPFMKSLYAEFSPILASLVNDLASRPETKES